MADLEPIGISVFREGERLAKEAEAERDRVVTLRQDLEVELARLRSLTAALQEALEAAERSQRARTPAVSA